MEKIQSFMIDHLNHPAGIYLSRTDGDIFTYDIRLCEPYKDKLLTPATLHSLEHLLATVLRNSANKDDVIYAGPMGCQTGFYVLMRNTPMEKARDIIITAFRDIMNFEGKMPGKSKKECGYFNNLSLSKAKRAASDFLIKLKII